MTIREAIDRADALKPNTFELYEKVKWLSELDGKIFQEVMLTHEESPTEYHGYTEDSIKTTELLAPFPYDDLYVSWLIAMIDLENREIVNYNNSLAVFNAKYAGFTSFWNRTHMPKGEHLCFFGRKYKSENCGALVGMAGEEIANPLSD